MNRFLRQTMIDGFGEQGQSLLKRSSVLIVGLGGLGAPVSSYLVSAGVGKIGLCDKDVVSETNLQRQILYTEEDVSKKKTDCALSHLSAMSSNTIFKVYPNGLTDDNAQDMISDYDVIMDCTDNFIVRLLIDNVCRRLGKPWIHGSIDTSYGCVTVFNHTKGKSLHDLYNDISELSYQPSNIIGTFGPVVGMVGSIQAMEAIKLISGYGEILDGTLLTIDLKDLSFAKYKF